ncbi:DeoR/GlpR family DNA-binding transcription regulator [Brachybacterium sp. Marseille-Q7125]|uniref:DeoR/GlpR family DNA-binding transcription regulator n=1 Tax=Brachybacterium sp. Marseille-Q7125 TaxID=2932815 RepID=UPI001FF4C40D|nr:DeoR/GlpR family DNA-binding transcription regulator [Brachybacterium sp. Marseille-Q7125]
MPIGVDQLARLIGASPVTIRRDLTDLQGRGLLRRVHGGAVAVDLRGMPMPYALRAAENAPAKAAIARAVAALVRDDMALVLDNGSTVTAVADALTGRPLTAMCLTLRAAMALGTGGSTDIVTPGGSVRGESLHYGGAACLDALDGFRADLGIMGACSASPSHGLTSISSEDAQIKRAILAASARVMLAVTGDKLSRTSSFRFGALEDMDDLVTTPDAPASMLDEVRAAGTRVHLAR